MGYRPITERPDEARESWRDGDRASGDGTGGCKALTGDRFEMVPERSGSTARGRKVPVGVVPLGRS